jgi:hypothetical protein
VPSFCEHGNELSGTVSYGITVAAKQLLGRLVIYFVSWIVS